LFWGQVLGFLGSLPFLFLEPPRLNSIRSYSLYTWLALLFLGTVYFSFAMVIFYRILARLDAGQIMVFTYLQPVFGVLVAHFILHENMTVSMIVGGVLVVLGTLLVALEGSRSALTKLKTHVALPRKSLAEEDR
jgi:drug/metabolite transporter (DMT)-like permease